MEGECGGVICHLQCEISSVSVTGLAGGSELFLRCHVPAGSGRAIQIDSGASATAEPGDGRAVSWRDVASLSCDGTPACVRDLVERTSVVFEVRRRPGGTARRGAAALRRLLGSSELVGRAEVAWKDVADDEVVERQVVLATPGGRGRAVPARCDVPTAPVLSVWMTVRVTETAAPAGRGRRRAARRESACEWSVRDEDVFEIAACAAAEGALE